MQRIKDNIKDRLDSARQKAGSSPPNLFDQSERQVFHKRLMGGKVGAEEAEQVMPQVRNMNKSHLLEVREIGQRLFEDICHFTSFVVTRTDTLAMKRPDPPNFHRNQQPYDPYERPASPNTVHPASPAKSGVPPQNQNVRPYAEDPSPRMPLGQRLGPRR